VPAATPERIRLTSNVTPQKLKGNEKGKEREGLCVHHHVKEKEKEKKKGRYDST